MNFADLLRSIPRFAGLPGAEEYAREMAAREERTFFLRERHAISREDALRIAIFTRGTWAQRYPVQSFDLGEDAALFIADWLAARAVGPSMGNMDAALAELRERRKESLVTVMDPVVPADVHKVLEALAATPSKPKPVTRAPNRFERRRAASRRWRG